MGGTSLNSPTVPLIVVSLAASYLGGAWENADAVPRQLWRITKGTSELGQKGSSWTLHPANLRPGAREKQLNSRVQQAPVIQASHGGRCRRYLATLLNPGNLDRST